MADKPAKARKTPFGWNKKWGRSDVDVAFHRSIAVATQNPLFVMLLDAIAEILTQVRRCGMALISSIDRGMGSRYQIFQAIQVGDVSAAHVATAAHLEDSAKIQRQVAGLLK